jgi:hypothetical protein
MKKLIILVIVFLITTAAFSQTSKWHASLMEEGPWNDSTTNWEYKKTISVDVIIIITKEDISFNDKYNTFLTINSNEGEVNGITLDSVKYNAARWSCTDEKLRDCIFSMIKYEDGVYLLSVMYNDYSFRYYVKPERSNSF